MIREFSEFVSSQSMTESIMRRLEIIWDDAIWTMNWREILFLISNVIVIFFNTRWTLTRFKKWLCLELIIFKNHEKLSKSLNCLTIMKKEYFIDLFSIWRLFWSWDSRILSSRSQINHVFLMTSSLDFFVRRITTTQSSRSKCSFTRRMRSLSDSNVCRFSRKTRDMMRICRVDK